MVSDHQPFILLTNQFDLELEDSLENFLCFFWIQLIGEFLRLKEVQKLLEVFLGLGGRKTRLSYAEIAQHYVKSASRILRIVKRFLGSQLCKGFTILDEVVTW